MKTRSETRLGLQRAGGDAEDRALAVLIHSDGDCRRAADDPPAIADLDIGGVEPEVGPCAFERAGEEGVHPLVDLGAEPADLALGHPAGAHGFDEVVDGARGNPADAGLLHHGRERLLGRSPRLQEARQAAALAQLRDLQRDPPGPGVPVPLPISIALNLAQRRARALRRAGMWIGMEC